MARVEVWERRPINAHLWAFYYYCRGRGDRVEVVKHGDGTATLTVRYKEPDGLHAWLQDVTRGNR